MAVNSNKFGLESNIICLDLRENEWTRIIIIIINFRISRVRPDKKDFDDTKTRLGGAVLIHFRQTDDCRKSKTNSRLSSAAASFRGFHLLPYLHSPLLVHISKMFILGPILQQFRFINQKQIPNLLLHQV